MINLNLHIDYYTHPGERLCVAIIDPSGEIDQDTATEMTLGDGESHHATLRVAGDTDCIAYRYYVDRADGSRRHEWGAPHSIIPGNATCYDIFDKWHDRPANRPYYSSAFTDSILRRDRRLPSQPSALGMVTFEIHAPMVAADEVVAIAGEAKSLGAWDIKKAPRLTDADYPCWRATVIATDDLIAGSQFKFLIVKKDSGAVVRWEDCDNRTMPVNPDIAASTVIDCTGFTDSKMDWRGAGTAIPVFSLRQSTDWGVGEFLDLIPLIDWASRTGQTFIQVLPVNDTTMSHSWADSYPYNANSTIALHPMYLRLSELGTLDDPDRQKYYDDIALQLNSLKELDYERVNHAKNSFTRELFQTKGFTDTSKPEFKAFVEANSHWLKPYAAYCILRDRYRTARFADWGEYAVYDADKAEKLLEDNTKEALYVYYLQYHLDKQLRMVREYAHSRGVVLKGDIPIGVSDSSVDAWQSPELFNLDCQAGAPPDDFSDLGQNWGFPTYNWDIMSLDGYAWWKARFRKMSEYFDAYRIDHVLGFFRIWEIPRDAIHGLLGRFNPALPFSADELRVRYDFWLDPDMHTQPFIMDYFLEGIFGKHTDEARSRFLIPIGYGRYRLRDGFTTQRLIADYFAEKDPDEHNRILCQGLMRLIDEVLFIPDPADPQKYHPRISATKTYLYKSLNEYERWCFDRLYNDFFYYRHNDFWHDNAMRKLPPLIDATDMLVCAEDLGMIPACVPTVMNRLQVLALEIQRMPKEYGVAFGNTRHYPYLSVCTPSTHDMSGIRAWWEEDYERAQLYYNHVLHESGDAPAEAPAWLCERILDITLKAPSMLCIIPLQDWMSIDSGLRRPDPREEQINEPQNSRHYWRYRMHLTVNDLLAANSFNSRLKSLINQSGRL